MLQLPSPRAFLHGLLPIVSFLVPLSCGSDGDTGSGAPGDPQQDAGNDGIVPDAQDSDGTAEAASPDAALPAMLNVRIKATTSPFPHADGLSGQTPLSASGGIRSLSLLRDENDTAPAVLFENGAEAKEASFDDGSDTVVGTTEAATVPPGHYTLARMVQAYSRYRVAATMHDLTGAVEGELDNLLVLGDGTLVDGQLRDAGYYRFVFEAPGTQPQTFEGEDALVPAYSTTAGAVAVVEDGQWAVYFPVDLDWSAGLQAPAELVITINMFESFRWTDSVVVGYQPGVFDITPLSYEPVVRFGGNEFIATVE